MGLAQRPGFQAAGLFVVVLPLYWLTSYGAVRSPDAEVIFRVTGDFVDGTSFAGQDDTVTVIHAGDDHDNEENHGSCKPNPNKPPCPE